MVCAGILLCFVGLGHVFGAHHETEWWDLEEQVQSMGKYLESMQERAFSGWLRCIEENIK